jgi:sortase A
LLLAISLGAILEAEIFQKRLSRRLEALTAPRGSPSRLSPADATRREARNSGLIGRLEIQRLGLSEMVVEGTSSSALRRGIGHVQGTAYPGERGNVGLAGHRDTYFRPLKDIRSGDRIRVRTPDGQFVYQVDTAMIVSPKRSDLLRDGRSARLTLVTCYPFYYIGPAPRRFVVIAHEVDTDRKIAARQSPRRRAGYVASVIR